MERSQEVSAAVAIRWDPQSCYANESVWPTRRLDSWEGIDKLIGEAQEALLKQANLEVAFDVIEVHVYGPDCLDLTLVDLPGIVRTVGKDESKDLVGDIKRLIDSYLVNPRCVILAVHPANVEFHNSQIMADAKVVDPDTVRTIPVITKPDQIDRGAEEGTLDLLLGTKIAFKMGFHMVKCRGQQALNDGVTMTEGLAAEADFFRSTDPWKNEPRRDLFGVVELRKKLAKLQVKMIQNSIHDIIQEIDEKRNVHTILVSRLGALITTDTERRYHYALAVKAMMQKIECQLEGIYEKSSASKFLANQSRLFTQFTSDVLSKPFNQIGSITVGKNVIVSLPDGSEERGTVLRIRGDGAASQVCVQPHTRFNSKLIDWRLIELEDPVPLDQFFKCARSGCFYLGSESESNAAYSVLEFDISQVEADPGWLKKQIAENPTTDLPCFLNVRVFNRLVAEMVTADWEPLCTNLGQSNHEALTKIVLESLDGALSDRFYALKNMVRELSETVLAVLFQNMQALLNHIVDVEKSPYTNNRVFFSNISKDVNRRLTRRILQTVKDANHDEISQLAAESLEDQIAHTMQLTLGAYGKLAAVRVCDQVPMLLRKISRQLVPQLQCAYEVSDAELQMVMQEDDDHVHRVQKAVEEKKKLDLAHASLRKLFNHVKF